LARGVNQIGEGRPPVDDAVHVIVCAVPDDDRKRRRLGDETKGRIADLASGWDAPAPRPVKALDDVILDIAEDSAEELAEDVTDDVALDDEDDDDDLHPDGWALPAAAAAPARAPSDPRARRPSASRSAPTESGTVDVSGVIPEKTQPPERIVPAPTVDASALLPASPGQAGVPAPAPRAGTRTSPPPPPGGRATGGAAAVPGGAASASGPIRQTSASGPLRQASASGSLRQASASGSFARIGAATRSPATGSIVDRLPLPADPEPEPPRRPTPTPVRAGRAKFLIDESGSETIADVDLARGAARRPAPPAVPVGELDGDAGSRGDPTMIEPAAARIERGDPTLGADLTQVRVPGPAAGSPKARLRTIAQLQRRRGVGGDMRYVLTTIFGLRRARRELAALEVKEATLQQSRRRHLLTLGRTAVSADGFEHAALRGARARLAEIEEERARHTGQVSAADAELQRATRDREDKARQHAAELAEVEAELAEIVKKLEPLEKENASVTRRAAALRDTMRRLDEKLAFTEARLTSAESDDSRAAIQAEIASIRAERKAVQEDEPELAAALDSLHPRIAKLEAARVEARRRRGEIEQAEQADQRRTEEVLAAIGARRKVLDRAAADAEAARDKILFELGERLYVDRPATMAPELSPIDAIDVELGTVDRRTMELREILQSVDRWKLVRGVGLWILLLAAIGAIAALALGLIPL
jgi:hypothetical protein